MPTNFNPVYGDTTIPQSLVLKSWAKKTWQAGIKESYFSKFMGRDAKSIIHVKEELSRGRGTTINIPLLMPLFGAGVIGDNILEGKEEALVYRDFEVPLNQVRHAVRLEGHFEEHKIKNELTCVIPCAKVKAFRNHNAHGNTSQIVLTILNVPACFVKHKGAIFYDGIRTKAFGGK